MKLSELIIVNEARRTGLDLLDTVIPWGNSGEYALFPGLDSDNYYVFNNANDAEAALEEFSDPKGDERAIRQRFASNERPLQSRFRNFLQPNREVSVKELQRRDSRVVRSYTENSKFQAVARMTRLAGVSLGAFYGVVAAIDDVSNDPELSPQEKEELINILNGQLFAQLVAAVYGILRKGSLIRRAWPAIVVILGAMAGGAAYSAVTESRRQLNEVAFLPALYSGAVAAGGFLLRAATSVAARAAAGRATVGAAGRAAAGRVASSSAGRAAAGAGARVAGSATGRNAMAFLKDLGVDVFIFTILSQPALQRSLAEAISAWGLGDIVGGLGNLVTDIVVVVDELTDGAFGSDRLRDALTGAYDQRTIQGIEGEYFSDTEWAKDIFGPLMFPGDMKSINVPYIAPVQRENLLNSVLDLNANIEEPVEQPPEEVPADQEVEITPAPGV